MNKLKFLTIKMFSLMKKQFFTLVMMLAIVVLASTSAMAQNNTATSRQIMITGSTHTFTVTPVGTNTVEWLVYKEAAPGGEATTADVVSYARGSSASYAVNWAESASGNYYIEATETRQNTGLGQNCANTVRRYYVTVYDFDVEAYISDINGGKITGTDDLADCGQGTEANYGDMGNAAFSNAFNTDGILGTYIGTAPRTTRYVSLRITWNGSVTTPPAIGSMRFNIAAAASSDLYSINSVTAGLPSIVTFDAVNGATGVDARTVTFPIVGFVPFKSTFEFNVETS